MTLIEAMTKAKIDEYRLADLAGLTPRAIKSYLYKERKPSNLNQSRIERVLKAEIDWGYKKNYVKIGRKAEDNKIDG